MYSWEITEFLKQRNYEISAYEYSIMLDGSTQIVRVKYNAYSNSFDMWDRDGMYWNYKVYLKNN